MALTKKKPQQIGLDDDEGGFGEWYSEHATAINWVLTIVLVAIIGWRGYGWWQQSRLESASNAYSPVHRDYAAALEEQDVEKKRKALSEVVPRSEAVSADFAGRPVGREAQLLAANAQYYLALTQTGQEAQESFKKARASYEKYLAAAGSDQEKAIGQLALGNTLENLFFLTRDAQTGVEATKSYQEAAKLTPGTFLSAEAKLAQARLLQAQAGRQDEARKLYQEVAEERKVPATAAQADATTQTTPQGQVVTPEDIAGLRTFHDFSYQAAAERNQVQLQGLPTAPGQ